MKKALNFALLISFVVTNLVPLTGVPVHKMASVVFLLLCVVHTLVYRDKLGRRRYLLLGLTAVSFASGLLGMIFKQYPLLMSLHRVFSIGLVFFLAIHIFVFHKKLCPDTKAKKL